MPALPAEALLGDVRALGLGADQRGVAGAVALAEGVAADGQRHRLLVVHAHPAEGLADVARRFQRVGLAARPFGIDIDQAHLDRRQRVFQRAAFLLLDAGLVVLVPDPELLGAPIDVLVRLPHIGPAAAEAEHRGAHRFERDIAGHDHQIGPAQLLAVFLLDRPQQPPRLVEIGVVGPGIERGEALLPRIGPAAPVAGAVGAGAVPGHADEERAVMPVIGRPPRLAVGHQRFQVGLDRLVVERAERLHIVEPVAHRVAVAAMLVEDLQAQLVGPPVAIGAPEQRAPRRALFHRAAVERVCAGLHVHLSLLVSVRCGRYNPPGSSPTYSPPPRRPNAAFR